MDKKKQFLLDTAYYGTIAVMIFLAVKFLFPIFLPFALAGLIAYVIHRISRRFGEKIPIKRKYFMLLAVTIFYAVILGLILWAGKLLLPSIVDCIARLPKFYQSDIVPWMERLAVKIEQMMLQVGGVDGDQINGIMEQTMKKINQAADSLSVQLLKKVPGCLACIPDYIIRLTIMIISTYFIAVDYDKILGFIKKILPEKGWDLCCKVKKYSLHMLWAYLKSYSFLMFLTFGELFAGLWLLHIPCAGWIALGIAAFDILPIVGTGGILLPWAGIAGFMGDYSLAAGLLILYGVITIVRNILEPRIVGKQIGLHPLAALIAMFAGVSLAGIPGLILFPVLLMVVIQVEKET